jgi:hypothetical protein
MSTSAHLAPSGRRTRALAILAIAVLIVPLLRPDIPPLVDLPGHIGRYHVQTALPYSPALQQFFALEWRIVPNLGVDLLVQMLAPLLGVERAAKLIVMLIPALTGVGFLIVARAVHGRIPATSWFALPLTYNYAFAYGFVNYTLAVAFALLAFALWLALGRPGWLQRRALLFWVLAPLIWLTHINGWAMLVILVAGSSFADQITVRRNAVAAVWTAGLSVLPLTLPIFITFFWGTGGGSATYGWFDLIEIGKWTARLLCDRWEWFDVASVMLLCLVAALPMLVRSRFAYQARLAVPAALLWLAVMVLPDTLMGSAHAGVRLLPYALALTVIAVRPGPDAQVKAITTAALLFLAIRMATQTISFAEAGRANDAVLTALAHVGRGSRIATLVGVPCDAWSPNRRAHIAEMATVRRDAFTNGHWAMKSGQVLRVIATGTAPMVSDPSQFVQYARCAPDYPTVGQALAQVPRAGFDYVWIIGVPPQHWPQDRGFRRIWQRDDSVLYRMSAPGDGSAR